MKKVLLITVIYLLFIGCSSREPITWKRRILESKVSPVELAYSEYGVENRETLLLIHGLWRE